MLPYDVSSHVIGWPRSPSYTLTQTSPMSPTSLQPYQPFPVESCIESRCIGESRHRTPDRLLLIRSPYLFEP